MLVCEAHNVAVSLQDVVSLRFADHKEALEKSKRAARIMLASRRGLCQANANIANEA
jgi:hypothetical protein